MTFDVLITGGEFTECFGVGTNSIVLTGVSAKRLKALMEIIEDSNKAADSSELKIYISTRQSFPGG